MQAREQIIDQFYQWEALGRGWLLWEEPCHLEPPFIYFNPAVVQAPAVDDGRTANWFGKLIDRFIRSGQPPAEHPDTEPFSLNNVLPTPDNSPEEIMEIQILAPENFSDNKGIFEQFLFSLGQCHYPVSFEIVGSEDSISIQFACREIDANYITHGLISHFPEIAFNKKTSDLLNYMRKCNCQYFMAIDFGLSDEFFLPIKGEKKLNIDPLVSVINGFSEIEKNEFGMLQAMFIPVRYPWTKHVQEVFDLGFDELIPYPSDLLKQKFSSPIYAVCLRIASGGGDSDRVWRVAQSIGSGLRQLANPHSNELIPLTNDDYDPEAHLMDIVTRRTRRSGMLLNSQELLTLIHLPSEFIRNEKLLRIKKKTRALPSIALNNQLLLGINEHNNKQTKVTLNNEQRTKHTYIIGGSGTGKSTLLLNLIIQDIENGEGLAVLDPHGDLIDRILDYIPEHRKKDVILFDPSDEEYPVGFNILEAKSELEKTLISSDLVAVFKRLSSSWGDQMNSVLANAIIAFLESEQGGTLSELRRFLVEPDFRNKYLETVNDPEIVYYWKKEYPLLSGKPQGPVLTRLDTFLRPKLIRHVVCQKKTKLDFSDIMNNGKIFLAKLAQGAIGEENAYLLGTFLVAKFHQIALSRQDISEASRRHFWLFIDEFHNFVTPSMTSILSGARKFKLGLILAHQELRQLGRDSEIVNSVLANAFTRICFRLGDMDANKMAAGFSFFDEKDLQTLSTGETITRLERSDYDFNMKTHPLPETEADPDIKQNIITNSRTNYGTPLSEILKKLAESKPEVIPTKEIKPEIPQPVSKQEEPILLTDEPGEEEKIEAQEIIQPPKLAKIEKPIIPSEPGKGGREHKYLQNMIKQLAAGMDWKSTIEKQIPNGSVDVLLEKEKFQVACEISVTTSYEQEMNNVKKCLKAKFTHVVSIAADKKFLNKLNILLKEDLSPEEYQKITFATPEDFFDILQKLNAEIISTEKKIKGYKVRVKYQSVTPEERDIKKQGIGKIIHDRLKQRKS